MKTMACLSHGMSSERDGGATFAVNHLHTKSKKNKKIFSLTTPDNFSFKHSDYNLSLVQLSLFGEVVIITL